MLYRNKIIGSAYYMGGVPSVFEDFCWAFHQMTLFNCEYGLPPGQQIHYDRPKSSLHAMARNWIAENFKGDWVLMLDTDHLFEPDVLVRLKHAADQLKADVVSAVYVQKSAPFRPTLFNFDEKTEKLSFVAAWDREAQGVLNVNCAGAGTLFIRRKVFDAIYASGELPFTMFPPSSAHPFGLGEDFSFFLRLKRLGIPVYAVPQIESFHIQPWPLSLADYQMPECSAPTANQTLP